MNKFENTLKDEIRILKKIISNYNQKYLNYSYLKNFNNIYGYLIENNNYIKNSNSLNENNMKQNNINVNIYNFYKENNFIKKTEYLINILEKYQNNSSYELYLSDKKVLKDFKGISFFNNYYFIGLKNPNVIGIFYYFQNEIKIKSELNLIKEDFSLYSTIEHFFSISSFDDKIIIGLNRCDIYILKYNLEENQLSLIEEIKTYNWKQCIEIKINLLLIIYERNFVLWSNKSKIRDKNSSGIICEVISINNEYFVALIEHSFKSNLIYFYKVDTFDEIKQIKVYKSKKIAKFRDEFIISKSSNKIYLIYIKTQELVTFFDIEKGNSWNWYINNELICLAIDYTFSVYEYKSSKEFIKKNIKVANYNDNKLFPFLAYENFWF